MPTKKSHLNFQQSKLKLVKFQPRIVAKDQKNIL
jgi:hypothetical protein